MIESTSDQNYQFTDYKPLPEANLYRLKMIDLDGTFSYSKVRSLVFDEEGHDVGIYPNPATERVYINLTHLPTVRLLQIYDVSGKLNYQSNVYPTGGLSVSDFPIGLYLIKVSTFDGRIKSLKFLKN